jgi:hypothetical protein
MLAMKQYIVVEGQVKLKTPCRYREHFLKLLLAMKQYIVVEGQVKLKTPCRLCQLLKDLSEKFEVIHPEVLVCIFKLHL